VTNGNPITSDTLEALENTFVPINDLLDLAERLIGKTGIPRTVPPPTEPYRVGDQRLFWVTNVDSNELFQVEARLEYVTPHLYFWIENGVDFNRNDLQALANTFENEIYPTNREFFGSEWLPGVDGDPHVYVIYARNLGFNLAGVFSSTDEYHPDAHEYSNAIELFLLNADNISLYERFTYGVLAHEFQHMIHWYQDRNESTWLNEGFSELAALLNGYYDSGFDWVYMQNPDIQLNDWPNDPNTTTPHYGSGFLFVTYFLDRFGEDATRALVANSENGLSSVDSVLNALQIRDSVTGETISAEDVFLDWVITNYVQDASIADGRFAYKSYSSPPQAGPTEIFENCPLSTYQSTVHQFGVDYFSFTCPGSYTLRFEGTQQVGLLPEGALSGKKAFWSNKGEESDMTLTRRFDFRQHSGKLTLNYWAWYDLEEDYDYLYLLASLDGKKWQNLTPPSGTDDDPTGNSYGWAYNGISGNGSQAGWIQESVDLSSFAGEEVLIRFEYITDAAVNGEGFLLEDIAVPEIGYFSDFEEDNGGWEADGWVRIENVLPQSFHLAIIIKGRTTSVQVLELDDSQRVDIPIEIGGEVSEVVLVVTGTTRFTRQQARYQFEILP
jgi:hypothetical protein